MSRYTEATRATVMWLVLLLLLAVPGNCKESTDGPYYLTKNITNCPDVGYFFELKSTHRGSNDLTPGLCYLCFCQEVGKASCVRRNRKRCEVVRHHHVKKRESRSRRSVFFKDVFLPEENEKPLYPNLKTNCSLGEPKKTYTCPPGLCEGCFMCECTAEGHWNCNVTSDCPKDDKKIKNKFEMKMSTASKTNVTETMTNTNSKKLHKVIRKLRHTTPILNKPHHDRYNFTTKEITLNKTNTLKNHMNISQSIIVNPNDDTLKPKEKVHKNIAILKKKRNIKHGKALKLKLHDFFRNRTLGSYNDTENENLFIDKIDKDYISKLKFQSKTNVTNTEIEIKGVRNKRSILLHMNSNTTSDNSGFGKFVTTTENSITEPTFDTIVSANNNGKIISGKTNENYSYIDRNMKTSTLYNTQASYSNVRSNIYAAKEKNNVLNPETLRVLFTTEKYQKLLTNLMNDTKEYKVNNVTNKRKSFDNNNVSNKTETQILLTTTKTNLNISGQIQHKETKNKITFLTKKSDGELPFMTEKFMNFTSSSLQKFPQYNKSASNAWLQVNISKHGNKRNLTKSDIKGDLDSQYTNGTWLLLNLINSVNNTSRKIPTKIDIIEFDGIASNINKSLNNTFYTLKTSNDSHSKKEKKTVKKLKKKSKSGEIHKTKFKKYVIIKSNDDQYRQTKSYLVNRNNGTSKIRIKEKKNVIANQTENSMVVVIRNKKNQNNTTSSGNTFRNYNLLQAMSRTLDQNDLNRNKKFMSDLQALKQESKIISKKIKIITKLLNFITFLDDKKSIGKYKLSKEKNNDDTQKLRAIIDGSYSTNHKLQTLPKTQLVLVEFLKNNTKLFTESLGTFSSLFYEVTQILTANNNNKKYKRAQFSKHMNNESRVNNLNLMRELVEKFKTLLFKYNLIQNLFFKKIYDVIENFELNLGFENDIKTAKITDKSRLVNRNITKLDTFTKEILDNFQNIKEISIRGNKKQRVKRQIYRDDDHLEYLLILMEYLIKQSLHLNSPSANDGIDLLIEAIRNAPDIKPIKKKVLQYIPVPVRKKAVRNKNVYEDSESINSNPSEDDFIFQNQDNISKAALKEDNFFVKIYNTTKDYLNKYKYFGGVKPRNRNKNNITILLSTENHENQSLVTKLIKLSPPSTESLVNELSLSRKTYDEKLKNISLSTPDLEEYENPNDGPDIKLNLPNNETTLILETETEILENSLANNKSKQQSTTEREHVERPIAENESYEDEPDETSESESNGTLTASIKLNTDNEISKKITVIKESVSNKEFNRKKNTTLAVEMTTKVTSAKPEIVTNICDENKENKLSNNDDKIGWLFSSEDEENIIDKEETTTPIAISLTTNSMTSYNAIKNITKDVEGEQDSGDDDVDDVMYKKEMGLFNSLNYATEKYEKVGDKEITDKNTEEYLN